MNSLNTSVLDVLVIGSATGLLFALELHTNSFTLECLDSILTIEETGDFFESLSPM